MSSSRARTDMRDRRAMEMKAYFEYIYEESNVVSNATDRDGGVPTH